MRQCRYCQIGTSASLWWFCRLCWRILLCCLYSFCKFVTNPKNQQHLVTLQNADATPKQKQLAYTALVNQLAVEMQMPITQIKLLLNNGNSGSCSR
jgi:hypothetical protein